MQRKREKKQASLDAFIISTFFLDGANRKKSVSHRFSTAPSISHKKKRKNASGKFGSINCDQVVFRPEMKHVRLK